MDRDPTDEAKAKGDAELSRLQDAAKKPDKARKPLGLIDPDRLTKALRYLQQHPKR